VSETDRTKRSAVAVSDVTDETPSLTDRRWYVLQLLLSLVLVQLSVLASETGWLTALSFPGLLVGVLLSVLSAGKLSWQWINRPL